jgi:hypothetical protein
MKNILLISIFLAFQYSFCQGKHGCQILISTENDFLGINNEDENYTGSLKVELSVPGFKWKYLPFIRNTEEENLNITRFGFGGTAYTPQDLANEDVVIGDRPYASLTFFNFGNTFYNKNLKLKIESDIIIGYIGAPAPGNAQSYIHENHWFGTDRPIPKGWDNQIGYDGSFILNYNTRFQKFIYSFGSKNVNKNSWLVIDGVGKIDLGNYMINLQGGIKLNFFNLNTGILQDYNVNIPSLVDNETEKRKNFRFNLFVEPYFRIVGYNTTLEGLMFNDSSVYKIPHSDINRFLFEINAGVNFTFFDTIYIKYSMFGRSQEFEGGKSFHSWGGITIGFSPARWNYKK